MGWVRRIGGFLLVFALLAPEDANAAAGTVRSDVDARKIGTDDTVTFSITLEGDAAGLDVLLPPLKNLRVLGGPSTSTQISFINGSMLRQKTLSYLLKAEKAGTAEIGSVSIPGYPSTTAITIDVVTGAIRPAQADPLDQDPFGRSPFGGRDPLEEIFGRAQRRRPEMQGKIFVEAAPSRTSAYVGEPILVTYRVYTQIALSGVEFADAPKYPGFWAEEVDRSRDESRGENVVIQGEPYLRYPVLERLVFPTRAGTLEIPEARLRLSPAGGVFGIAAPIERNTKALRVNAEPLPPGAPENGVVGSYKATLGVDRTAISLGEAFSIKFKVAGKGNLKWVDAAPILTLEKARIFPPRITSDLRTSRQGVEGSKTWEFVVVPEKEGVFEVPALQFSYFDLEAHALRTEETAPVSVAVTREAASDVKEPARSASTGISLRADLDSPARDFTPAVFFLAAISVGVHLVGSRVRGQSSDEPRPRKESIDQALRELRAESLLSRGKERMATLISQAIESVFGARVTWPKDDFGDRLRGLADDLEFLRFAPQLGSYDSKMKEVRDRAIDMLETLR